MSHFITWLTPGVETNLMGTADLTITFTVFTPGTECTRKNLIRAIRQETGFSLQKIAMKLNQLPFIVAQNVDAVWARQTAETFARYGAGVYVKYHTYQGDE